MMVRLREYVPPNGIIYGPVFSRRLGSSLGINLLGEGKKVCPFDCLYCQLSPTTDGDAETNLPPASAVEKALLHAWSRLSSRPDRITFSGNGEPTAHPEFEEIVHRVSRVRDEVGPLIRIAVLTNGAYLDRPRVAAALSLVEEPIVKLDAGSEALFQRLDQPRSRRNFDRILEGIRRLPSPILQTLFVTGSVDNAGPADVGDWIDQVGELRPAGVQIHTLDRPPADATLRPVSRERLRGIAARFRKSLDIPLTVVFPD